MEDGFHVLLQVLASIDPFIVMQESCTVGHVDQERTRSCLLSCFPHLYHMVHEWVMSSQQAHLALRVQVCPCSSKYLDHAKVPFCASPVQCTLAALQRGSARFVSVRGG